MQAYINTTVSRINFTPNQSMKLENQLKNLTLKVKRIGIINVKY